MLEYARFLGPEAGRPSLGPVSARWHSNAPCSVRGFWFHVVVTAAPAAFLQLLAKDELTLVSDLQKGYVNFYNPDALMPYVPLAAKGPWIVTAHGTVAAPQAHPLQHARVCSRVRAPQ